MRVLKRFSAQILTNPLLSGSLIMVIGSNFSNAGQFIYHFFAGRMLGKVYYGDLASLVSIIGIIGIIQLSIGLTIVKFISSSKDQKVIANLIYWFNIWAVWLGAIGGVIIFFSSPVLIKFLNLHQPQSFYLMPPIFFLMVVAFTQRSILQGLLKFDRYVVSLIIEIFFKLLLTVIFVIFGLIVFGAMLGILFGVLAALAITYFSVSTYLKNGKGKAPDVFPLIKYSLPVFIQGAALTSMYSTDLLLVKHFFSAETAGIYASLAVLGRIVFFGSYPIAQVMFPLVAKRHAHNESYHKIFYSSVAILVLISAWVTLFYVLFPELIINILYGSQFIEGAGLLWLFGVFMGLLGLASIVMQFYLSIGKTRIVYLFPAAAFSQILLIWFIHPDILTVIKLSILSVSLLVVALFVYFPYHNTHKNGKA